MAAHGPSGAGISTSSCTGVIAPIVDARAVLLDPREPGAAEHQRLRRPQPAVRHVRDDDRPPADDDDVRAVAEGRDRLVLGARHEDLGRGVGSHTRYSHHPTLLGREISARESNPCG